MSNHLLTLAIGLSIGATIGYLVTVLAMRRPLHKRGRPSDVLELQTQPLTMVRLNEFEAHQDSIGNPLPSGSYRLEGGHWTRYASQIDTGQL